MTRAAGYCSCPDEPGTDESVEGEGACTKAGMAPRVPGDGHGRKNSFPRLGCGLSRAITHGSNCLGRMTARAGPVDQGGPLAAAARQVKAKAETARGPAELSGTGLR